MLVSAVLSFSVSKYQVSVYQLIKVDFDCLKIALKTEGISRTSAAQE